MKLFCLLLIAAVLLSGCNTAQELEGDVMVWVNDEPLYAKQFDNRMDYVKNQIQRGYGLDLSSPEGEEMIALLENRVLQDLVWEMLLLQRAEEMDVQLDEDQIAREMERVREQHPTETDFKEFLQAMNYTEDEYETYIKHQLMIETHLNNVADDIEVGEDEIQDFFQAQANRYGSQDRVAAKHLLYDTEEKAQQVMDEIGRGASFQDFMDRGQDLGFFSKGDTIAEFDEIAFNMKKGDIAGPVKTVYGYHILYVYDLAEGKTPPLDEIYEQVEKDLLETMREERISDYLQELFEASDIVLEEQEKEEVFE